MHNDCVRISGLKKVNADGSLELVTWSSFVSKLGKYRVKPKKFLKIAFGDATMSLSCIFEWYARFCAQNVRIL